MKLKDLIRQLALVQTQAEANNLELPVITRRYEDEIPIERSISSISVEIEEGTNKQFIVLL